MEYLRGPFFSTRPLRGLLRTPAPWAGGPSPSFPNLPYYTFSPLSAKAACRLERWGGMARAGIFFVLVVAPSLSSLRSAFFSLLALPLLSSPLLSPPLPPCREASFSRAQWRRERCCATLAWTTNRVATSEVPGPRSAQHSKTEKRINQCIFCNVVHGAVMSSY